VGCERIWWSSKESSKIATKATQTKIEEERSVVKLLIAGLLLSSRERMTLEVGIIFLVYFLHNVTST
jgi:hypothetical protein